MPPTLARGRGRLPLYVVWVNLRGRAAHPFVSIAAATILVRYLIHDRHGRTRRWIVYLTPATVLVAWLEHRRGMPLWLAAFRSGRPLLDAPPLVAWMAVAATVAFPLGSQCASRAASGST